MLLTFAGVSNDEVQTKARRRTAFGGRRHVVDGALSEKAASGWTPGPQMLAREKSKSRASPNDGGREEPRDCSIARSEQQAASKINGTPTNFRFPQIAGCTTLLSLQGPAGCSRGIQSSS